MATPHPPPNPAYDKHLRGTLEDTARILSDQFGGPLSLSIERDVRCPGSRATVVRCRVDGVAQGAPGSVIMKRFLGDHGEPYDPNDPAAQGALLAYATTLGRLHAVTAGQQEEYAALHRELAHGGSNPSGSRMVFNWTASGFAAFREACAAIDLPISNPCLAELDSLPRFVDEPGPFYAYSMGDTCPDNHRYTPDNPGYVRFYDMELGGFQHALLDAAYLWMPFPTCWCVSRLPASLPARLEAAYRAELVRGCPPATDDAVFKRAMANACGIWFVLTVAWSLTSVLEKDDTWGISSVRQRFPLRAKNFARVAQRAGSLPNLAALAKQLSDRLRDRWGDEADMPLYAPFRGPG